MTDVTKEMLIEYMRRKGGRVKNVDLVKYFRKHLLYEDPQLKGEWGGGGSCCCCCVCV